MTSSRTIHFITNGVFMTSIAGGDIHFLKLAEGAARAGYALNYFGGHALQEVIQKQQAPGTVTLTDEAAMPGTDTGALSGQIVLFRDFFGRYRRTLRLLARIAPEDFVYATSDYWFDVLPAVRCAARRKLMVLHMEAPTLGQIVRRSRPDVDRLRLASLHYWASQAYSLRRLARCPCRHVLYLHPLMEPRLQRLRIEAGQRTRLSYGLEVGATEAVPAQERVYDVVWIGRVHRQKGIDDLVETLAYLNARLPGLRAVFIGNVRAGLESAIRQRGLEQAVEFPGFVPEAEKVRLFKASRLFLMPSRHEGSPRVIGESVIAGTPVVAYDIPNYRPLFGDFVRYAPPFDLGAFQRAAERELLAMRASQNYLDRMDLDPFKQENSWETTQARFLQALERLA